MSDAFITRRGGSGGLSTNSAVLHITAASGSTISLSKGGVVVKVLGPDKSHVSAESALSSEWYYSVSPSNYGSWTVTAEKDGNSKSATVSVSANKQYDVALFRKNLYKAGDQSGWTPIAWKYSTSSAGLVARAPTLAYTADKLGVTQSQDHSGMVYHTEKVDVTIYSLARLTGTFSGGTLICDGLYVFETPGSGGYQDVSAAKKTISATGEQDISVDISSLSGEYYIGIGCNKLGNQPTSYWAITGVWLE